MTKNACAGPTRTKSSSLSSRLGLAVTVDVPLSVYRFLFVMAAGCEDGVVYQGRAARMARYLRVLIPYIMRRDWIHNGGE